LGRGRQELVELDHISAAGPDLKEAARWLSLRMGFTISRGADESHLRIILDTGYLELRQDEAPAWRWTTPLPVHLPAPGGPRPQDLMEPERAKAVTTHANTAIGLGGVLIVVPEIEPVIADYEESLGHKAGPEYRSSVLGITAREISLPGGLRVVVGTASFGTGPAIRFAAHHKSGIFAPIIKVRSLQAAADALRKGAVYSFYDDKMLVTSAAMPEMATAMIFESTTPQN